MKDHNPQNITPEFIDIDSGFRFLTTEEFQYLLNPAGVDFDFVKFLALQHYANNACRWVEELRPISENTTYRTLAPRSALDDWLKASESQQPPFVAIEFEGVNVRIAEEQEEYQTLPANVHNERIPGVSFPVQAITFCWKLSPEALAEINRTGVLWHTVLTGGAMLQPQRLDIYKPEF